MTENSLLWLKVFLGPDYDQIHRKPTLRTGWLHSPSVSNPQPGSGRCPCELSCVMVLIEGVLPLLLDVCNGLSHRAPVH